MRKSLLVVLATVLLTFVVFHPETPATTRPIPREPLDFKVAVRLDFGPDNACSGTVVAPNAILSAAHCFSEVGTEMVVNDRNAKILRILQDHNDHSIVIVDITFSEYASFGTAMKQADNVYYWGNPYMHMMYRRGYVSGFRGADAILDINGFHGDSGAGIFDEKRRLVGVINYMTMIRNFSMMGSRPLNFTAEQLKIAGVTDPLDPNSRVILSSGIPSDYNTMLQY